MQRVGCSWCPCLVCMHRAGHQFLMRHACMCRGATGPYCCVWCIPNASVTCALCRQLQVMEHAGSRSARSGRWALQLLRAGATWTSSEVAFHRQFELHITVASSTGCDVIKGALSPVAPACMGSSSRCRWVAKALRQTFLVRNTCRVQCMLQPEPNTNPSQTQQVGPPCCPAERSDEWHHMRLVSPHAAPTSVTLVPVESALGSRCRPCQWNSLPLGCVWAQTVHL